MKVAIGCDHAGFSLKQQVIDFLKSKGIEVLDVGPYSNEIVDYPIFAEKVAIAVSQKNVDRGIVICGSGIGVSIVANKVPGVRAALCNDIFGAKYSRLHNNANVLAMGERVTGWAVALEMVDTWLNTPFEGGKHIPRLDMIREIEEKY